MSVLVDFKHHIVVRISLEITHLLQQQSFELDPAIVNALTVCGIDHPYQRVRLLKIVFPVRAKSLLPSYVPFGNLVWLHGPETQAMVWDLCALTYVELVSCPKTVSLESVRPKMAYVTHPSYSIVLMMKPSVGETLWISSPIMLLTIDVLPLLSSPLRCFSLQASLMRLPAPVVQH